MHYISSGADSDTLIIEDVDDLLRLDRAKNCPSCGYVGLEYDDELRAWIHDYCGYYQEEQRSSDDVYDAYGGWLD